MAKRKRKSVSRRSFFASKTTRRRSSSTGGNPMHIILPAMAYGAGRQYLSALAQPLTSKIPLGNYADELVFGIAGFYLAKKQKGMLGQLGRSMLTVECASAGSQLMAGFNGGSNSSNGAGLPIN